MAFAWPESELFGIGDFLLSTFLLLNQDVYSSAVIPCPSHHCILGAGLLSGFIGPKRGEFCPRRGHTQSFPIPDSDYSKDEIWGSENGAI